MKSEHHSTVVLGFDALDFDYLDRFREALPNFSALRSDGVEAPLRSTFPPWTGSAWPSMYTGVDPSYHGVYGFLDFTEGYPDDATFVTREEVDSPALWNYLTMRDIPSVIVNVPITYPAEPIEGVLIPGYLAPEDAHAYPPGIRTALAEELDHDYRIYSEHELSTDNSKKLEGYIELIKLREDAAEHLLQSYDWQLAVIQIQKTDAVFHNFDCFEAFQQVYETADSLVGTVTETAPDANVVVCSDHGIGPVDGYQVHINEVLRDHGFVTASSDSEVPSLATKKPSLLGTDDGSAPARDGSAVVNLMERAAAVLGRLGIRPGDVYTTAERVGLESQLLTLTPESVISSAKEHVDWQQSAAYCRGTVELGIRINLESREPNGVVPREEYEDVRTELIRLLSNLETPSGQAVFEFVKRREEVYDGPHVEQACDIVFLPTNMNHIIATNLVGKTFVPLDSQFDHKRHGVFIATGPAFDSSAALNELSLTDVAPVVMASLGQAVPNRMTGDIPEELLTTSVSRATYTDVAVGAMARPPASEANHEQRLADLGYLR